MFVNSMLKSELDLGRNVFLIKTVGKIYSKNLDISRYFQGWKQMALEAALDTDSETSYRLTAI